LAGQEDEEGIFSATDEVPRRELALYGLHEFSKAHGVPRMFACPTRSKQSAPAQHSMFT